MRTVAGRVLRHRPVASALAIRLPPNLSHRPLLSTLSLTRTTTTAAPTRPPRVVELVTNPELDALGLDPKLQTSLIQDLKITKPTNIQAVSIPSILKGQSGVVCGETGSGKTVAYLTPLVQRAHLRELKEKAGELDAVVSPRRSEESPVSPRIIVLVPTRELADQTARVAKKLSHNAKICVATAHRFGSTARRKAERERVLAARDEGVWTQNLPNVDLLVGAPRQILDAILDRSVNGKRLEAIVVDEADTMVATGKGFEEDVSKIVDGLIILRSRYAAAQKKTEEEKKSVAAAEPVPASSSEAKTEEEKEKEAEEEDAKVFPPSSDHFRAEGRRPPTMPSVKSTGAPDAKGLSTQVILVGATTTQKNGTDAALKWLRQRVPSATLLRSESAGRLPRNLHLEREKVAESEGYDKHPALERAVRRALSSTPYRTGQEASLNVIVVFCSSVPSSRAAAHTLSERLAGEIDAGEVVVHNLHGDMPPQRRQDAWTAVTHPKGQPSGATAILVCTDVAARGIDLTGAKHVVLLDFPKTTEELIHRAGRTARAGKRGFVTLIVGRGDGDYERILTNAVKESRTRNLPLRFDLDAPTEASTTEVDPRRVAQWGTKRKQGGAARFATLNPKLTRDTGVNLRHRTSGKFVLKAPQVDPRAGRAHR